MTSRGLGGIAFRNPAASWLGNDGGRARNLAAWARPGARFLLLTRSRGKTRADLVDDLRGLFTPAFQLIEYRPTGLERPDGKQFAGGEFRLVRALR